MREIKFRGMIKGNNYKKDQWVYGYLTRSKISNWTEVGEEDGYLYFIQHSDLISTQIELNTLGQYTGLLDKNGKEIWEGDIIAFGIKRNFKVIWAGKYGAWGIIPLGKFENEALLGKSEKACEIIGNIYETPELIKS